VPSGLRRLRTQVRDLAFLAGVNLYQIKCLGLLPRFVRDWRAYEARRVTGQFPLRLNEVMPVLVDFSSQAGVASGQYFHQDLHVARRIYDARPARHVDVGSRIDGFVAHLLTFMPVTVVDVRPLDSHVPGLLFEQGNLVNLSRFPTGSVESISSLHTVEHVGLGRYGDDIDPDGWKKSLAELARVVKPTGRLYVSVPVGVERVKFNAHRIFSPHTVIAALSGLQVVRFDAVDDGGELRLDVNPGAFVDAHEALGIFEMTKAA
jgi:hypothetical protein